MKYTLTVTVDGKETVKMGIENDSDFSNVVKALKSGFAIGLKAGVEIKFTTPKE